MSSTITALTSGGGLAMAGDTSGQLELKTNNGTTAVTVTTAQNVGIGNTSPAAKLQVTSASSGATPDTNADELVVEGSGQAGISILAGSGQSGRLYFGSSAGSAQGIIRYDNTSNFFQFATNNTDAMRITSTGEMKLGGTGSLLGDNNQQLAITSTTCGISVQTSGNKAFASWTNSGSSGTGNAATIQQFFNNSAQNQVGTITSTGTNCLYNNLSDYRLKDSVTSITNGLSLISALNPVTFKWTSNQTDDVGFIAHEFQNVIPSFVTGDKDAVDEDGKPVYQAMDSSGAIPLLVAAIKELNAKVDAQALEIQALKGVA